MKHDKKTSKPLPMSKKEMHQRGWDTLDIIIVTGDAYVDHPSFGAALIGRLLEARGFRVGIIAQPTHDKPEEFKKLGKPKLFFAATAGNMDSMVSNYTPSLKPRKRDMYSSGGTPGMRPDRATIVYSNRIHQAYPDAPIVIAGVEASLRRLAQYDFQSGKVRKSILADAPADLLIYGMGETQTEEIARRLQAGEDIKQIKDIPGTVWKTPVKSWKEELKGMYYIELESYTTVSEEKEAFARNYRTLWQQQNPGNGKVLVQPHPKTIIVQNPPAKPLETQKLDEVYELPYTRQKHPAYKEDIPAIEPVRFSLTTHRGCFGACSFCAIAHHQGRMVNSRSIESLLREAKSLTKMKDFKGNINGVGGPTANMYSMECPQWKSKGVCTDKFCLYPKVCPSMNTDHSKNMELLNRLEQIPGVKKVFITYGVRYDLALTQPEYLEMICKKHVSGRLAVAPEHYSKKVTDSMRKPGRDVFEKFVEMYSAINKKLGKEQYLQTYLMSGHPGCGLKEMIETAEYIRDNKLYSEQVQDFTPTPMTASTCMYHTGIDPFTGENIEVATSRRDKKIQRTILHYRDKRNRKYILEALKTADRMDLVGNSWKCLISGKNGMWESNSHKQQGR
jgi:uncharacterized radical SAM protein YgiQ